MKTIIKIINNQEYICEQTNSLKEDDFIIFEYSDTSSRICKVIHIGCDIFQYKVINKENTFGWETFRRMIDISKLIDRKGNMEFDTLFNKIVGIGFELNS